jgi:hypothetical protein
MAENDPQRKKQDPRVEQLRPDPSESPPRGRPMSGLWGESDREGFRRLYLTSDLTLYAEFRLEDVLLVTDVPADQAPFVGEQSTRIELRIDAPVEITHARRVPDVDEFDLDVRFGTGGRRPMANVYASSVGNRCVEPNKEITDPCGYSCDWMCKTYEYRGGGGCPDPGGGGGSNDCGTDTCATCAGATQCGTCNTDPYQTNCGTCHTQYGETHCGTCHTDWGHTACGGCDRLYAR